MAVEGSVSASRGVDVALQHEVCQFLYLEAELLDDRRFEDWYALFTPDVRYRMPIRSDRLQRQRDDVSSAEGGFNLADDDHETLGWRVRQMVEARHWAEDPPSRTRHLVANVRIRAVEDGGSPTSGDELAVRSNFLCYRNRLRDEVDLWAGERHDVLRLVADGQWRIARRTVLLDQNVVLSKNLSVFL